MLTDYFVSKKIVCLGDQLQNKITQKVSYIQYNLKYKYKYLTSYIHIITSLHQN